MEYALGWVETLSTILIFVIGRFRYAFEHMGEFFRQYFFAQDREEMPFKMQQEHLPNRYYNAQKAAATRIGTQGQGATR